MTQLHVHVYPSLWSRLLSHSIPLGHPGALSSALSMGCASVRAALSTGYPVSTGLFFTSVSLVLPYTQVHQYRFCIFYVYWECFFFPFRSKDYWVYYTIPVIQLLKEVKESNLNLKFIDWACLYILTMSSNNSKKSLITTQTTGKKLQTAEIPNTNRTKALFPPHNRV